MTENTSRTKTIQTGTFLTHALTYGIGLHLAWEFAQSPFFAEAGLPFHAIAWARFHCTLADVALQSLTFFLTSFALRDPCGPFRPGWPSKLVFILIGVVFTVAGEEYHVRWLQDWYYNTAMPEVPGLEIGWTPILQWLIIPTLWIGLLRNRSHIFFQKCLFKHPSWYLAYGLAAIFLAIGIFSWWRLVPMYGPGNPNSPHHPINLPGMHRSTKWSQINPFPSTWPDNIHLSKHQPFNPMTTWRGTTT